MLPANYVLKLLVSVANVTKNNQKSKEKVVFV
jgi:hypothetical protein